MKKAVKKRKYTRRAKLPAENVIPVQSATQPTLPPYWQTQHDMRAEQVCVRFSVVLQVDVPQSEFDREEANSQARIAGFALEKNLPAHSRLVFVSTDTEGE